MNRAEGVWSIILAGGEGERLKPFVERWLGRHKPKQYCTFIGTRSMLEHTLDRADRITSPERKVTIIARAHRAEARPQLRQRPGQVIMQPANRDTAAGIFLALTHVRKQDHQATVVVFPSDHFVYPEDRFVEIVQSAVRAAIKLKDRLIMLGVSPDRLEPEYGWIHPGRNLGGIEGNPVRTVEAFVEKPSLDRCRFAMASGGLWNTFILATQVESLWEMGWRCFPEMMSLFERYAAAIGTPQEGTVLDAIYQVMPSQNFSRHLLQRFSEQVAVTEMNGVLWCDWGKPERILETLSRIGKQSDFLPAFADVV
jgi:mannose-1-phosphate guanylyltransferase